MPRVFFPMKILGSLALMVLMLSLGADPVATHAARAAPFPAGQQDGAPPKIDYDALWAAQPALVARATAGLPARAMAGRRVFTVTVAAGGSQAIFGREAEAMRDLFRERLGKGGAYVLLSNAYAHNAAVPLANRDNLAKVVATIGQRYNPASDIAVIYLTAHGAPDASLQTDLPDAFGLRPIDAKFLAETLNKAGIARRIVIVSACFSGTWVPPLASPDTIVLTASAANRTSFGCDDRNRFTFFGGAMLGGTLRTGATWRQAFERLQADIVQMETQLGVVPSQPGWSVGTHMDAIWNGPLGAPVRH